MGVKEHLADYAEYLRLNKTLAVKSKKKYISIARLYLMTSNAHVSLDSLNSFISDTNKGNKQCQNYKYALKVYCEYLNHKDWGEKLLKVRAKPRKKQFNYVSNEILNKILRGMPKVFKRIAFVQLKSGSRFTETILLKIENIDFNVHPDLIYITVGQYAKGGKTRKLRLHKKYAPMLKEWMNGRTWGFLFLKPEYITKVGEEVDAYADNQLRYYNEQLGRLGNLYGVDNLSSHYLRHLFADNYMKHGGSESKLKDILGHARIETTLRYISIQDRLADEVMVNMG